MGSGTFGHSFLMTGSKDTTLKLWDASDGSLVRVVSRRTTDDDTRDYRRWCTALCPIENSPHDSFHALKPVMSFLVGYRDGFVQRLILGSSDDSPQGSGPDEAPRRADLLSTIGVIGYVEDEWHATDSPEETTQPICKSRNQLRVNGISMATPHTLDHPDRCAWLAVPRGIVRYEMKHMYTAWRHNLHENDWVYCVQTLETWGDRYDETSRILTAIGSTLSIWTVSNNVAIWEGNLIEEGRRKWRRARSHGKQRPHIASMERLSAGRGGPNESVICACFDGNLRLVDMEVGQGSVTSWKGHEGRIWSVKPFSECAYTFASSGDDGYIHFWDTRTASTASDEGSCVPRGHRSVKRYGRLPGRVSALCRPTVTETGGTTEYSLVSGSCPDNPSSRPGGGALLVGWDVRK